MNVNNSNRVKSPKLKDKKVNTTNTSAKLVVLLSEVLNSGNGCPVCGGEKTKRARTCASCLKAIGAEATRAVDAVISSAAQIIAGHKAALASSRPMNRNVTWGPALAQIEITPGAMLKRMPQSGVPYWDGQVPVTGGHVSLFVFGAAENAKPGDVITALVELKTKVIQVKGKGDVTIHYVRAQVVNGVTSNVALAINDSGAPGYKLADSLPFTDAVEEGGRAYTVGFTAAKDIKTGAGESSEAKVMLAEMEQAPG